MPLALFLRRFQKNCHRMTVIKTHISSSGCIASVGPSASTDAGVVADGIASGSPYYGSHHQQFPRHQ